MEQTPIEQALALKAGHGDQDALEALIGRVRLRLFGLAYAELRHYDDAHDAVAAALLRICLHIQQLRHPENVNAWVDSIVRREAHRLQRQESSSRLQDDVPAQHDAVGTALLRIDIEYALSRIPYQQSRALRLHYLDDLSVREVALRVRGSEGTVKMWLH